MTASTQEMDMLTDKQFDAQWTSLLEQQRAEETGVRATWDQKKAKFLAESGWTQEAIAERIGKSQAWVTRMVCFGRFLESSIPAGNNDVEIPANLTERMFRTAWAACKVPSEESRFESVSEWLVAHFVTRQQIDVKHHDQLTKVILDQCADGQWRSAVQMARKTGLELEEIVPKVQRMVNAGAYKTFAQMREFNGETQYKIRHGTGKKVQLDIILAELEPLLKELEAEGKKEHMATYCPSAILDITFKIRKLLKERST